MFSVPIHTNISLDSTTFPEGGEVSIPCDVEGHPRPQVSWYKDDYLLIPSNRVDISGKAEVYYTLKLNFRQWF